MSDIDEYNSDGDSVSSDSSFENNKNVIKKIEPKENSLLEDEEDLDIEEEADDENDDNLIEDEEEEEEDEEEEEEVDDDNEEEEEEFGQDGGAKKTSVKKDNKVKVVPQNTTYTSDDENDEENDDFYLQKMDAELNKNYVVDFHPECSIHNYDEISIFTHVVRDSNNNIIDSLHKTIPFLTKYEKARVLGQRAKQINSGAKTFIKVPENVIDGYIIAELELQQKRIPFIIRRPFPGGGSEYWNLRDLEIITF